MSSSSCRGIKFVSMMHINVMEKDKIIFWITVGLWMLQFFLFKDQLREEDQLGKDSSLPIVQAGFLVCIILSIIFTKFFLINESVFLKQLGILFIVKGITIRYWAYFVMKDYFTRKIYPHKDRPLISSGPYRFARHPFHVGLFLIVLGLSLFLCGHLIAFFIVFPIMGSTLHYRMSLEEQLLRQKYGEIYHGWCRHRFRLLPFLY